MDFETYTVLATSLLDEGPNEYHRLPGANTEELFVLWRDGGRYDDVDRVYVDHETIGGG